MSLMSDVTHQVKILLHAQSIHHSQGDKKKVFFFFQKCMCANEDMLYACMSSSLVGSSSSGSGSLERGKATNRLQRWWNHVHDMLKKGSWCVPLSKA